MTTRRNDPVRIRRVLTAAVLAVTFLTALCGVGLAATGGQPVTGTTATADTSVPSITALSAGAVQKRLVALRYLPASAVSGRWDCETSQALVAFQAWQGLARDGKMGPRTAAALATAKVPVARLRPPGRQIEVYRALGMTLLVDNGHVVSAIHSSSGKPGYTTPAGTYRVFFKSIRQWSSQYHVWLPYASFFNRGIGFHSYPDVPAYAASHGCIRIPAPYAPMVYSFAKLGTQVVVF